MKSREGLKKKSFMTDKHRILHYQNYTPDVISKTSFYPFAAYPHLNFYLFKITEIKSKDLVSLVIAFKKEGPILGMEIIYENTKDKEIILSTGPLIPTQLTSIIDTKSSLRAEMLYELFIQGKIRSEIQYEKIRLEGKEKILEIKGTHSPDSINSLFILTNRGKFIRCGGRGLNDKTFYFAIKKNYTICGFDLIFSDVLLDLNIHTVQNKFLIDQDEELPPLVQIDKSKELSSFSPNYVIKSRPIGLESFNNFDFNDFQEYNFHNFLRHGTQIKILRVECLYETDGFIYGISVVYQHDKGVISAPHLAPLENDDHLQLKALDVIEGDYINEIMVGEKDNNIRYLRLGTKKGERIKCGCSDIKQIDNLFMKNFQGRVLAFYGGIQKYLTQLGIYYDKA